MGMQAAAEFTFSAWARTPSGGPQTIHAALIGPKGNKLGEASLSGFSGAWKRYKTVLKSTGTEEKAHLDITFGDKGEVDLDMVSLYPKNTWKNRPNGLRPDLVQLLADMKPGFLRFPGGCIVEGRRLPLRYQWKKTVGDVSERRTIINRWNDEFSVTRPTPDYYQSFGLGFYEYFQLAEDIGASPLPVLNCGMACQFNSNELVPLNQLDPYIQDALDLIEFANGPESSQWGGLRAKMGHREPFHLKMLGVGNEQWGADYLARYQAFTKAIKAKYPEIMIVTGAGPFSDGKDFDFLWGRCASSRPTSWTSTTTKCPSGSSTIATATTDTTATAPRCSLTSMPPRPWMWSAPTTARPGGIITVGRRTAGRAPCKLPWIPTSSC